MKINYLSLLMLVATLLTITGCRTPMPVTPIQGGIPLSSLVLHPPPWHPSTYGWVNAKWVSGDPQYRLIRQDIDEAVRRSAISKETIETYERAYANAPDDKHLFFRWAYAAYKAGRKVLPWAEAHTLLSRVDESLAKRETAPYPREFVRLRFLLECWAFPQPRTIPVGQKLFDTDPSDKTIKAELARILAMSRGMQNKKTSLRYAQELLNSQPTEPAYHSLVAESYESFWRASHDPAVAAKAIAEYQIVLRSLPPDDENRSMIEVSIKDLQNGSGTVQTVSKPLVHKAKP